MVIILSIIEKYSDQIDHCTRCGLCQAVCPVFDSEKSELSVARGKIALMKAFLSGKLEFSSKMARYIELCAGCQACQEACPSGVSTEKLFIAAKEYAAEKFGLSLPKKAIVHTFSSDKALGFFSTLLNLYSISRAGYIADFAPDSFPFIDKLKLLNSQLNGKINFHLKALNVNQVKPALKLLYFPGCINRYINPSVACSAIQLLKESNCEVLIPEDFLCCGMPALNSGAVELARTLAKNNLKVFNYEKLSQYDYVVVDCATCGSMLKSYSELFDDDPEMFEKSEGIKSRIIDINELLVKLDLKMPETNKDLTVTYHDPCHLRRVQHIYNEPRQLITSIKGIDFVEMQDANVCCGAAGSFCITNSRVSKNISAKKAYNILQTKANIVLTSCPSCKIGLTQGLLPHNKPVEIYHTVELLTKIKKKEL